MNFSRVIELVLLAHSASLEIRAKQSKQARVDEEIWSALGELELELARVRFQDEAEALRQQLSRFGLLGTVFAGLSALVAKDSLSFVFLVSAQGMVWPIAIVVSFLLLIVGFVFCFCMGVVGYSARQLKNPCNFYDESVPRIMAGCTINDAKRDIVLKYEQATASIQGVIRIRERWLKAAVILGGLAFLLSFVIVAVDSWYARIHV